MELLQPSPSSLTQLVEHLIEEEVKNTPDEALGSLLRGNNALSKLEAELCKVGSLFPTWARLPFTHCSPAPWARLVVFNTGFHRATRVSRLRILRGGPVASGSQSR